MQDFKREESMELKRKSSQRKFEGFQSSVIHDRQL